MPVPLWSYADLPGPRGVPLLSNALQMNPPRMHLQIEQWCREVGPLFKLSMPGRRLLVVADTRWWPVCCATGRAQCR